MIRQNKIKIIISSLLILLPILFALIFWDKIPDVLLTHWNLNGVADGESKKNYAIFFIPLVFLLAHWICILSMHFDKNNRTQSNKVYNLVLWIFPILSNFVSLTIYTTSTGNDVNATSITFMLMGILFIVIGNYIPKCKQNLVLGVRLKWTLESEANWNATHRFTGKVWMLGGVLMLFSSLLPLKYLIFAFFAELFLMIILPTIYSYKFSKSDTNRTSVAKTVSKKTKVISTILLCAILLFTAIITFAGNINVEFEENEFTVSTACWQDLTVEYSLIESLSIKDDINVGIKSFGFNGARVLAGRYRNDQLGNYTLYSYTGAKSHIVIKTSKFGTLVISGKDNTETQSIYNELMSRTSQ